MLALGDQGRELLYQHGYDVGQGFVDVLSQYQSLEEAQRAGRLRDLPRLLDELRGLTSARTNAARGRRAASKKISR